MSDVFLNGKFIGTIEEPKGFVQQVIEDRRKGLISINCNIHLDQTTKDVWIENSKGRVRRPLIVVKDGQGLLLDKHVDQLRKNEISFSDLVKQGVIEYLDASEEENALIAYTSAGLTKDNTHLEIDPVTMFGIVTSLVPYANYSQAIRIAMGGKNQKQALGFYAANYLIRMDMDVNILHTPQIPITSTVTYDIAKYDKHPNGQNVVVAVMSYKGYNMEDSIIINKASIERGLGRSTYYRPAVAEEMRYAGGLTDEVCIPDKEVRGYKSERDYRFLEDDGIISPEAVIEEGDVIIGKTSPPRFLSDVEEYSLTSNIRRESSTTVKHSEGGTVDFVMITENEEGNKLVEVRVRDQRIPEVGDKFTSRHGQKGVIGLIVPPTDLPFSASGMTPDIIFSPHGIPSRMTISHLIELVTGKTGSLIGRYIDGTTFSAEKVSDLRKDLLAMGFREDGTECMYNGITGEILEAKIYIGSMYYLKLKHMVANKLHARARGPIQLLTRQPTEGRAKEGGLRLGEMEKDTFVAHGASLLLKERFDSDRTIVPVCEKCGIIAIYNEFKNESHCTVCGDSTEVNKIEVSYAFKLILDELKSLGIYPKLMLKNKY
ncbi:DNA-directed RNA polymerase subunit B [Candidatus Woesearchaeota archaeon]|nr:DNA-directed RNA polymerase subunit B [Candidatus Woesearchaeota archaeon]